MKLYHANAYGQNDIDAAAADQLCADVATLAAITRFQTRDWRGEDAQNDLDAIVARWKPAPPPQWTPAEERVATALIFATLGASGKEAHYLSPKEQNEFRAKARRLINGGPQNAEAGPLWSTGYGGS